MSISLTVCLSTLLISKTQTKPDFDEFLASYVDVLVLRYPLFDDMLHLVSSSKLLKRKDCDETLRED